MRKRSIFITFVLLIFTLQWFQPLLSVYAEQVTEQSKWKNWESKEDVPINKSWTVYFNQSLDSDSINLNNVYIVDSNNNRVDISFTLSNEGKELIIGAPPTNYIPLESYTLYITENILSKNQKALKAPIKMEFTVGEDKIEESKPLVPREGSKNEVVYQDNVKRLTEQQSQSMNVMDENTITANDDYSLKIGDVLVLPPSEEYPFGLAKKIISIDKTSDQFTFKTEEPTVDEIMHNIDISQRIPITLDHIKGDTNLDSSLTIESSNHVDPTVNSKVLNNGVVASAINNDIVLNLSKLKIGNDYTVNGAITLKNSELFVDINDDWLWKGVQNGVVEFDGTVDVHASISAKTSSKERFRKEIKVTDLYVPVPGLLVVGASIELFLVTELNGEVRLEYRKSMDFEVGAQIINGAVQKINDVDFPEVDNSPKEETSFTGEINFNGKIGMGAGVYLSIAQIDLAGMELDAGLKTKLATYLYKNTACYKGSNSIYIDAGIDVKILKSKYTLLGIEKILDSTDVCHYVKELNASPLEIELNPWESESIRVEKVYKAGASDYTFKDITFTSSNKSIAMVDDQGLVTINKNAKGGSIAEINVIYNNGKGNERKKTLKVTVLPIVQEPTDNEDDGDKEDIGDGTEADGGGEKPDQEKPIPYQLVGVNIGKWISAGNILLKPDGTVWAFGMNHTGELGLGLEFKTEHDYDKVEEPQQITSLPPIKKISSSGPFTIALTKDGKVYRWHKRLSRNASEMQDDYRPYLVTELSNVIDITATTSGEYYVKSDGTVWYYGEHGSGFIKTPIQMTGISDVVRVCEDGSVIKSDGTVWRYGRTSENPFIWHQNEALEDIIWFDTSSSPRHPFFVKSDGTAWQGYGDKIHKVEGLSNVAKISGSTILLKDGTVMQLVDEQEYSNAKPVHGDLIDAYVVKIEGLSDIVDIESNIAVDKSGNMWMVLRDSRNMAFKIEPMSHLLVE